MSHKMNFKKPTQYLIAVSCVSILVLVLAVLLGLKVGQKTDVTLPKDTNVNDFQEIEADGSLKGEETKEEPESELTEVSGIAKLIEDETEDVNNEQPITVNKPESNPTPTSPAPNTGSCPASTLSCVPCKASDGGACRYEPGAATGYLGWACQNNNPGNIRYSSARITLITNYGGQAPCGEKGGYMVFSDYANGRNSLKAYIKAINAGAHSAYGSCGNCSLKFFFSNYAPKKDQNDPDSYSNRVASWIGENAETTTLQYVVENKLDAFVDAIQRMEGFFTQ